MFRNPNERMGVDVAVLVALYTGMMAIPMA
jgi:hypothetical protein